MTDALDLLLAEVAGDLDALLTETAADLGVLPDATADPPPTLA